MPQDPRHDTPTTPEADRAEPFDRQAGPRGEDRAFADTDQGDETRNLTAADLQPDPRLIGVPANVDPESLEDGHGPQMDWGEPEPDAIHGSTHANRPIKTEAERGQGPKTRSRNKQIVSGKPYG